MTIPTSLPAILAAMLANSRLNPGRTAKEQRANICRIYS
jgi:hypothetical protein